MAIDAGTSWKKSLANSQVNDKTDTVYGQLQRHSDPNSLVNRRAASNATRKGSGRGLGNSSIMQGIATGAVIDRASENAAKDAEIYSNRRTENQRAGTHLEGTAMTNRNNLVVGRERNQNSLDVQALGNKGALEQIAARGVIDTNIADKGHLSAEKIAAGNNRTDIRNTDATNASREKIGSDSNTSAEKINTDTNASREGIADGQNDTTLTVTEMTEEGKNTRQDSEIEYYTARDGRKLASDEYIAESGFASDERIAHLNNDTKIEVADMEIKYNVGKDSDSITLAAWENYQTGLANIDPNAKPESQSAMATRIKNGFEAFMEFTKSGGFSGNEAVTGIYGPSVDGRTVTDSSLWQTPSGGGNVAGVDYSGQNLITGNPGNG